MDIATLGYAVDTTSLVAGTKALDDHEKAAERVAGSAGRASANAQKLKQPLNDVGRTAALSSQQLGNLSYQLNDVLTGLASGQSPFMILAQQGGQVYQVLGQAQGGVGAAVRQLGSGLASLLTPVRLAIGGLATIGTIGVVAYNSWDAAQRSIAQSLAGVGRASGVTRREINSIADATAELGGISISEGRKIAQTYAATGKIAKDNLQPLTSITKDVAATFGVELEEASGILAKALAEPTKGFDTLNQRLGFGDEKLREYIRTLEAFGDKNKAQQALIEAMTGSLVRAEEQTSFWGNAWNAVSNAISDASTKFSQFIGTSVSGSDRNIQGELDATRKRLEELRKGGARGGGLVFGTSENALENYFSEPSNEVDALTRKIAQLEGELRQAADAAKSVRDNLLSIEAGDITRALTPEVERRKKLTEDLQKLDRALANPGNLADPGRTQLARDRLQGASDTFLTPFEKEFKLNELSIRAANARGAKERAAIAAEQERINLSGQALTQEERKALIAQRSAEVSAQNARQESDASRERLLAARQQVDAIQLEISLIGKTAGEAERLRAEFQLISEARLEAARNNTSVSQQEIAALQGIARAAGEAAQKLSEMRLSDEIQFEREQLGRSPGEQDIAARLRGAGIGSDTEQGKLLASQLRYNDALRETQDIARDTFGGIASDLARGTSALDAMQNALTRLTDRFIQMATDQLVARAFGGGGQGGGFFNLFGGGFGGGAGDSGGTIGGTGGPFGAQIIHGGGTVGANDNVHALVPGSMVSKASRYHSGMAPDERLAILQTGEQVRSRAQVAADRSAMSAPAPQVHVIVNAPPGSQVSSSRRQRGNIDEREFTISAVNSVISGGHADKALNGRFAATPKVNNR